MGERASANTVYEWFWFTAGAGYSSATRSASAINATVESLCVLAASTGKYCMGYDTVP